MNWSCQLIGLVISFLGFNLGLLSIRCEAQIIFLDISVLPCLITELIFVECKLNKHKAQNSARTQKKRIHELTRTSVCSNAFSIKRSIACWKSIEHKRNLSLVCELARTSVCVPTRESKSSEETSLRSKEHKRNFLNSTHFLLRCDNTKETVCDQKNAKKNLYCSF